MESVHDLIPPDPNKDQCKPIFSVKVVLNEAESTPEKPVFQEIEYVEVIIPGSQITKPIFRVEQKHIDRWPEYYKAWKEGKQYTGTGFPLREWPRITESEAALLNAIQIESVEELANAHDDGLRSAGGSRLLNLKEMAKEFLTGQGKKDIEIQKLKDENEDLARRMAALEENIAGKTEKPKAKVAKKD